MAMALSRQSAIIKSNLYYLFSYQERLLTVKNGHLVVQRLDSGENFALPNSVKNSIKVFFGVQSVA